MLGRNSLIYHPAQLDILSGIKELKIAVAYRLNGQRLASVPDTLEALEHVEVEYETLPGWTDDLNSAKRFEDLPANAQKYVTRVEELMGVHARWIGVGVERHDIIDRGPRQ